MNRKKLLLTGCLVATAFCSCKKEDSYEETYPNMITELADVATDANGALKTITLDNGNSYDISNSQNGFTKNAIYRLVCGYVPTGNMAELYQVEPAYRLRDSSEVAVQDPTGVTSVWRAGKYINFHLSPLTQGGTHYWGFSVESIEPNHATIKLHHRQNGDPTSYTTNVYASLAVDMIEGIDNGDVITLHINTFNGIKTWNFLK